MLGRIKVKERCTAYYYRYRQTDTAVSGFTSDSDI